MSDNGTPKGGAFLLGPVDPAQCFTPEDFSDEHKMIMQTTLDFVAGEIAPKHDQIVAKDEETIRGLLAACGELGLLGTDVPEEYGGMGLDKISTAVACEAMGLAGSFAVSYGAHTGIGTLPIVYYGTEEQKAKYLPDLASGAEFACYALTEPGAGSDAVGSCRTKAVLNEAGTHYILNGEKIWITNGGWAKSIVAFAKIDGVDFSAFICTKDMPGVSHGAEEHKLGIQGSSTTPIIFEDAEIPVENLLYERGKGAVIALNVLNIGRYKLGLAAIGGAKGALGEALKFAKERVQFGKSIVEFGAIREKLAKMATKIYAAETEIYRTVGNIEATISGVSHSDPDYAQKASDAIREFAIECSINKVHGSEVLDFVVDECVQIMGGSGYCTEYPAEEYYRDARINRIFEGTNEINRMTIPGEILKRAMKGKLPLMEAGMKLLGELMEYSPLMLELPDEPLAYESHMAEMCKKAVIMVAGVAAQKLMAKLANEQEILMRVADMIIETYTVESCVLRAKKAQAAGNKADLHAALAQAYLDEAIPKIHAWGNECLAYLDEGDDLRTQLVGLRKLLKYTPVNSIALKRVITNAVIDKNGYPLA